MEKYISKVIKHTDLVPYKKSQIQPQITNEMHQHLGPDAQNIAKS